MGIEIKFTDKEFPASPVFINFLYRLKNGLPFNTAWHDQLSEELERMNDILRKDVAAHAGEVLQDEESLSVIYRSYQLLTAFLTGVPDQLKKVHERHKFICVVGVPRHGGTYLTKQLFLALGMEADKIPSVIAHDGFPGSQPYDFTLGFYAYSRMMQHMAEFLAIVEKYFANAPLFDNRVIVPKKVTQAAYHGAFFNRAMGPDTEFIITLRHPVTACISTYEKSTGLPKDGKFKMRSNIEEWVRRDNIYTGVPEEKIFDQDYFDAYLHYWEHYHYNLVLTGLRKSPNWQLVTYGKERMEAAAQAFFTRFKSDGKAEEFKVFDKRDRHPEWFGKAEPAILRVRDTWRTAGLEFPLDEIMEAW